MKKIILVFCLTLLFLPVVAWGQEEQKDEVFTARVIQIVGQKQIERVDGSQVTQQNIKLNGLDGRFEGRDFEYVGISSLDVVSSNMYRAGDKVHVLFTEDADGNDVFYITDYVRSGYLLWLVFCLFLVVVVVARWKGFKALLSLILTFVVMFVLIIPQILNGVSPVGVTIIGSMIILLIIVYLTEGINRESHISVLSIAISLLLTGLLATLFINLARLTGGGDEQVIYLIGLGQGAIDFRGLLMAGIIIGTLGALDDGVISQVAVVGQLKEANADLSKKEIYKSAMKIGTSHIGSMINTLFLAYAGAALPLLILFSVKVEPFMSLSQILNNEMIATEIVRAFVGSIGLAMAIPIATLLAVYFLKVRNTKKY